MFVERRASSRSLQDRQGTEITTGPPVARCRLTTHAVSSIPVSFVCQTRSCLRGGLGAIVFGQNWQRVPLAFDNWYTPESVPGSQQKVCASARCLGCGGILSSSSPRGVFGSHCTTPNQMRSGKPRMLSHTVRREIQSRGLGPVCLVSDSVRKVLRFILQFTRGLILHPETWQFPCSFRSATCQQIPMAGTDQNQKSSHARHPDARMLTNCSRNLSPNLCRSKRQPKQWGWHRQRSGSTVRTTSSRTLRSLAKNGSYHTRTSSGGSKTEKAELVDQGVRTQNRIATADLVAQSFSCLRGCFQTASVLP